LTILTDSSPLLAAVDALLQVSHALVNIPVEHVLLVYCSSTSSDNLVAYLGEKALHSVDCTVVFGEFPYYTDGA